MNSIIFGEFEIDLETYELRKSGNPVRIGPKPFDLLLYLIENRDRVISHEELVREVWHAEVVSASSVPTGVTAVRKILGDHAPEPRFVQTTRGRGYRFIADVEAVKVGIVRRAPCRGCSDEIFGRDAEIALLSESLDLAVAGRSHSVLIIGEAGIGKTRLLDELALVASKAGVRVLIGRSFESRETPAFWPWIQVLKDYLAGANQEELREIEPYAPVLSQLLPDLSKRFTKLEILQDISPEHERYRLLDSMVRFLRDLARARPLLVALEDLHQADKSSLLMTEFLAGELRDCRILFAISSRSLESRKLPQVSDAVVRVARSPGARSIQLRGLSRESIASMMDDIDSSLVDELYEQTGGNPFFLTQLAPMIRRRAIEPSGPVGQSLPSSVREAVMEHVTGLPGDTIAALEVAAVSGRDFSIGVVAKVLRVGAMALLRRLGPSIDARVIERTSGAGRYRFRHSLVRDVVSSKLTESERSRIHWRTGVVIAELFASDVESYVETVANHLVHGVAAGTPAEAIRYCMLAGALATKRLAYETAREYFKQAIEILDLLDVDYQHLRCELLVSLGASQMRSGEREEARSVLLLAARIAKTIESPVLLAESALAFAPGFSTIEVGARDEEFQRLLEDALRVLDENGPPDVRARVLARLAMAVSWSSERRRREEYCEKATRLADSGESAVAQAYVLSARHSGLWGPSGFGERLDIISKLGSIEMRVGDPEVSLMHRVLTITALFECGDISGVDREIESYSQMVDEMKVPHARWYVSMFRATRAMMSGDFQRAERLGSEFLAQGNAVDDTNAPQSLATQLTVRRWLQGRAQEMLRPIEGLVRKYTAVAAWRCVLLYLKSEVSQVEDARREYEKIASTGFGAVEMDEGWSIAMSMLAGTCVNLKDRERAKDLYDILLPAKDRFVVVGYGVLFWGSVSYDLARLSWVLGEIDRASELFRFAIQQEQGAEAEPWVARSQLCFGEMLASLGEKAGAEELLVPCLEVSRRLNLEQFAARARASLGSN